MYENIINFKNFHSIKSNLVEIWLIKYLNSSVPQPNFLKNNAELMELISNISDAGIEDGGSGAFYIFLKKK